MSNLIGDGKPRACRAAAPEKPRQEARGAQRFRGQRSRASQTAAWKDKDRNSVKLVFIPSVAFNFLLAISFHKWHSPFSSLTRDAAHFQLKVRRQIKSASQHCLMTLWVLSVISKHTVKPSRII